MKGTKRSEKMFGLQHGPSLVFLTILFLIGTPKALFSGSDFGPPSFSKMADEVKYCVVKISTTQVVQTELSLPKI